MTTWDPSEIEELRKLKEKFKDGDGAGETPIHEVVNMDGPELPKRKICRMPGCGKPARDTECPECYAELREMDDYERGLGPLA